MRISHTRTHQICELGSKFKIEDCVQEKGSQKILGKERTHSQAFLLSSCLKIKQRVVVSEDNGGIDQLASWEHAEYGEIGILHIDEHALDPFSENFC